MKFTLGKSDEDVADLIGLSRRMLYLMRTGKSPITNKSWWKLEQAEMGANLHPMGADIQRVEEMHPMGADDSRAQSEHGLDRDRVFVLDDSSTGKSKVGTVSPDLRRAPKVGTMSPLPRDGTATGAKSQGLEIREPRATYGTRHASGESLEDLQTLAAALTADAALLWKRAQELEAKIKERTP